MGQKGQKNVKTAWTQKIPVQMKQETEPGGECADAEHSAAQRASEKKIQIFIANKLKKVEKLYIMFWEM